MDSVHPQMISSPIPVDEKADVDTTAPKSVLYDAEAAQALEQQWARQAKRKRRLCHFLGVALVLGLWATATKGYSTFSGSWFRTRPTTTGVGCGHDHLPGDDDRTIPIPPGVVLGDCVDWSGAADSQAVSFANGPWHEPKHAAFSMFPLPLDTSSDLFFIAQGRFSFGHFNVNQTDYVSKDATVNVQFKYDDEAFLDHIKVCMVARVDEDGTVAKGVGAFSSRWYKRHPHGRHRRHWLNINLQLPKTISKDNEDAPLKISSLTTDMPLVVQSIEGLKTASFGNLRLNGAQAPIYVEDIWADNITAHSANSPISGTYRAWNSITLKTQNSPIDVKLELQNLNSSTATRAELITTNSPVKAEVNLTSSDASSPGGKFNLSASTVNGAAAIAFLDAPVDSVLDAKVVSALGPVEVQLHPTYEGTFALRTVLSPARLNQDNGVEDPAGKGRQRIVDVKTVSAGELIGSAWWVKDGEEKRETGGTVVINSSFSPVTLAL